SAAGEREPMTPGREAESGAGSEKQWRSGTGAPFVIADAGDDRALGLVNLQLGEGATIGVSVFAQARRSGRAPRALRLAAEWGLEDLGLECVIAEAAPDNEA